MNVHPSGPGARSSTESAPTAGGRAPGPRAGRGGRHESTVLAAAAPVIGRAYAAYHLTPTQKGGSPEHIKESARKRGESTERAEEIAARTVNKERARSGASKTASKSSTPSRSDAICTDDRP